METDQSIRDYTAMAVGFTALCVGKILPRLIWCSPELKPALPKYCMQYDDTPEAALAVLEGAGWQYIHKSDDKPRGLIMWHIDGGRVSLGENPGHGLTFVQNLRQALDKAVREAKL